MRHNLMQLTTGFESYVLASPVSFTLVEDCQVLPHHQMEDRDNDARTEDGFDSTIQGCAAKPQVEVSNPAVLGIRPPQE
jgi:hypothetical protein